MAYNLTHARHICSNDELKIFEASTPGKIGQLTSSELQNLIKRSRDLRDKNRDLYRRQSISIAQSAGTKRGKTNRANERTQQKDKLFTEVLQRFEQERDKRK